MRCIFMPTYKEITPIPIDEVQLLLTDTFEIWKDKFNKAIQRANISVTEINEALTQIPQPDTVAPKNHASKTTEYGVATTDKYGHAKAGKVTPSANGVASAGLKTDTYALEDHVHPLQENVSGNAETASALKDPVSIDGMKFDGSNNIIHYGTCSTAATTVAKTVTLADYVLATGSVVHVKFANSNNASNATLNVNSTGAKNIRMNNMNVPPGIIQGGSVYSFIYDGTYWQLTSGGGGGSIATNGTGIYNNNLNNLTVAGRYFITTTASTPNTPLAIAASWWVDVSVYNNGSSAQILQEARLHSADGNSATQGPANLLVRCYDGTKWGAWSYQYAMFAG